MDRVSMYRPSSTVYTRVMAKVPGPVLQFANCKPAQGLLAAVRVVNYAGESTGVFGFSA
jgi:hypothetical protein